MNKYNELQQKAIDCNDEKVVVIAPPGSGKALKNGTKVLTELGWRNIEDIKIGEKVYGQNGLLANVVGVYPQGKKQIYKVTFSDGNIIECCEDHLWAYQTTDMHRGKTKKYRVHTTKYLYENVPCTKLDGGYNRKNIYTPMVKPIQFNSDVALPLKPYLLGALIGDGCLRKAGDQCGFTSQDQDIIERVNEELKEVGSYLKYRERYEYTITSGISGVASKFRHIIRLLNLEELSYNKSIPEIYLKASVEDRLQLLQGLIDTDGYVTGSAYEYYTSSKQLAEDVTFLCEGLGFLVTSSIKESSYVNSLGERIQCKDCYRLRIKASAEYPKLHWCKRKDNMWRKAQSYAHRCIISIEPTEEFADMTCISVDNNNHLYVTEHCIVTHNTFSLVGAISKYVKENPFDRTVAITFTKKAASELHFKLSEYPMVETATIHSWSLKELNRIGAKYKFKVSLLTDIQIQDILQYICKKLGYYSINYYLLTAFVMGNYNIDISDGVKMRFQKILNSYIQYKRDNGLYDFTDLPLYLYDVLMEYNETIEHVDALFVDEFQDVDPTQAIIFKMVHAKKHFYIGDPLQSIYMFRGAEAKVLDELEGFTKLQLVENYRSYQSIIDFSTELRSGKYMYPSEIKRTESSWIKCVRTDEVGEVYTINSEGDAWDVVNQKTLDADSLINFFMNKKPYILCRSNKQVKSIQSLGYKNVSTVHQAKGLEYSNVIFTDMELSGEEEVNIAYVACTRAQNSLMVVDFNIFLTFLNDVLIDNDNYFSNQKLF